MLSVVSVDACGNNPAEIVPSGKRIAINAPRATPTFTSVNSPEQNSCSDPTLLSPSG